MFSLYDIDFVFYFQCRGSVLHLQNEVPVKSPPPPNNVTSDIRRLLSTAAGGQSLSPQELQVTLPYELAGPAPLVEWLALVPLDPATGVRYPRLAGHNI